MTDPERSERSLDGALQRPLQSYQPHRRLSAGWRFLRIHGQSLEDCTPDLSIDELSNAILHLKNGKAPGVDMISAEEIVASGKEGEQALFSLCRRIWQKEEFPDEMETICDIAHPQKER